MIILIADSGSTKTNWVLAEKGNRLLEFTTDGINPYTHKDEEILSTLSVSYERIKSLAIPEEINFYGAGCSNEVLQQRIKDLISAAGYSGHVLVSHDLMAAARALFGKESGIACILGTGSSSCLYHEGHVVDKLPPLGYVLGDEGGGVDLGKRLLQSVLKRQAPEHITKAFSHQFGLNPDVFLHHIYFEAKPNKYLASFTQFMGELSEDPFIREIIATSFSQFLKLNVLKYEGAQELKTGFVGSVAFHFLDILLSCMDEYHLNAGPVLKDPMDALVQFHSH